ncbi:MAG: hypothetical protein ACOYXC_16265 [Candidatus Rifleibacteriota bacterium]
MPKPGQLIFYVLILAVLICRPAAAASYKISSNADFLSGTLTDVRANDPDGAASNYIRLYNTNPGRDGNSGNILATDTGRVFSLKRKISLTETRARQRYSEKIQLNIEQISGAKSDWSDLRLTDANGNLVHFRILNFEEPVDNKTTPVTLLFEANANPSVTTDYWLYYGNENALKTATESISPFYLKNHDFEEGTANWALCTANTLTTNGAVVLGIANGVSIIPSGFVGYDSKSCLLAFYPEGGNEGNSVLHDPQGPQYQLLIISISFDFNRGFQLNRLDFLFCRATA